MGLPACQTRRMAPGGLTRSYSAPSRPTSLLRGCAGMCTCPPLGAEECTRVSTHSNRSPSLPAESLRSVPQPPAPLSVPNRVEPTPEKGTDHEYQPPHTTH